MIPPSRALLATLVTFLTSAAHSAPPEPGPFFEPDQPFFDTQVEIAAGNEVEHLDGNFVVRGVVLPLDRAHALVFDQELLRVAGLWNVPAGATPVTPETMAQTSY